MLLENIAPNAFYDSEARFDPPKCDEDTRVEVIGELMDWMNDRENPQRLLCMTGAAGAGKSALQQTIAERCADAGILGVAFFFSSQDPTRNNLSRIISTIAFQLGQKDPTLQDYM
jgi:type II secretory pathway predicted ATPase ExeA